MTERAGAGVSCAAPAKAAAAMFRSRSLRAAALALLVLALSATSALAVAARLTGPSSARLRSRVTFTATGVPAGTYTMRLVIQVIPSSVTDGTDCYARVGHLTAAVSGRVTITGSLPTRLACSSGAGPVEGHYTARAGRGYEITVSRNQKGQPFGGEPFLKHKLRLTA